MDSESFRDLNKDPFLVLFSNPETAEVVNKYLQHEYRSENYDFIISVFKYQSIENQSDRKKLAKSMYNTYICPGSPSRINVPCSLFQKIEMNLSNAPLTLFLQAKTHVLKIMKEDFFPRFSKDISEPMQNSWKRILNKYTIDTLAIKFYENMFVIGPEVIPLFKKTDFSHSRNMFIMVIDKCIASIDNLKEIILEVDVLAIKHCKYGVCKSHLKFAEEALLKTLEEFDPNWDKEVEEAWTVLFSLISALLKRWLPDNAVESEGTQCSLQ
jgi:hemoglobin-like flavoprotein